MLYDLSGRVLKTLTQTWKLFTHSCACDLHSKLFCACKFLQLALSVISTIRQSIIIKYVWTLCTHINKFIAGEYICFKLRDAVLALGAGLFYCALWRWHKNKNIKNKQKSVYTFFILYSSRALSPSPSLGTQGWTSGTWQNVHSMQKWYINYLYLL